MIKLNRSSTQAATIKSTSTNSLFKSIQWKLVAIFVLVIISVMIVVGTFLLNTITRFYNKSFVTQMENVFSHTDFQTEIISQRRLNDMIQGFSGRLGLNSYRNYYILDKYGEVVFQKNGSKKTYLASDTVGAESLQTTSNIIRAISGKVGDEVKLHEKYMDYAFPIVTDNSDVRYIVYVRDSKRELNTMMKDIKYIILLSIIVGLIISVVLGFLFSHTITSPIATLTWKAKKIARGDFEQKLEVKSEDEIGQLTDTFNYMAKELKKTLDEVYREKNKAETILLNMTDGVIAFDVQGKVIHANPVSRKLLSVENDKNIVFDNFFENIGVDISLDELLYNTNESVVEKQIDINEMHIKAFFDAFKVEKEKAGGVVVVLHDVTKQEKLEMARREFVANVSHELRTPLTSIKSYAETLLDGAIEEPEIAKSFLGVINDESDRMTRLVKDLLLLSRLDYMETRWNRKAFCINSLVKKVVDRLKLAAKKSSHELTFTANTNEDINIFADKDRIEQVIKNIISNSIKYTPEGGKIDVRIEKIDDTVCISVRDNGIGIPKKDLNRIFERFYRVDKARSRKLGGTGLGLAIAKEIITAHKGDISINSEINKGTKVIIKLPIDSENV